ncbi:CAP domain-containing protein [Ruminiclostridium cellulolyticum]|uniref:SCP-like extracellular n=1 Tax=Ruminiclostridium cellulolyticum (strain ATCC 35319 / DSM 5812 / JCM 6584 / H10) TaxID=394503 RepID=B8I5R5_RUMCH|nr:CAP domain-containing protein [Ruminiclostridium cellulolyticum]ACL74732.1 SCP-like extracellular [Ruminiclostridium cellulolyticum H10]
MKKRKKAAIVLIVLVSAFTLLPIGTLQYRVDASQSYQNLASSAGMITAQDVNLRTGPNTKFDSLYKLKKGHKLTVMGKLGDWYAVYDSANGNIGAVSARYLKVAQPKAVAKAKKVNTVKSNSNETVQKAVAAKVIDVSPDEKALLDMVNNARREEGLNPLTIDENLVKIARLKATDMKNNNYFSHTSSYYGTPFDMMKKYGVKFSIAGENLAGNQSMEKALTAWLKENGNNLYNKEFTHTGIGVVESPTYGKLFVEMFMKK